MTESNDCLFCKIVAGEIPTHGKIFEDEETLAFLDIAPNHHGHTLVIPKHHFENLYTLPPETLCRLMLVVQQVSLAVREATEADGINLIMNNEEGAGQEVPHAHIHIIPRHNGDEWPSFPLKAYIGNEAETMAEKIKENLK